MSRAFLIENLTLRTWFGTVLPRLRQRKAKNPDEKLAVLAIDGSPAAWPLARWSARRLGVYLEKLSFRLLDIKDEQGLLLRLRIAYQDLAEVQETILESPSFQDYATQNDIRGNHLAFLSKSLVTISLSQRGTLWRALLLVQIAAWRMRQFSSPPMETVLFLERRPWLNSIERYARSLGITLADVPRSLDRAFLKRWLLPLLPPPAKNLINAWRHKTLDRNTLHAAWKRAASVSTPLLRAEAPSGAQARLAVEYYGHLNLDNPEVYSDLFFWQQSELRAQDLVVLFGLPADPLDASKLAELRRHGLSAAVLRPEASRVNGVSIYQPSASPWLWPERALERGWLKEQEAAYQALVSHWTTIFSSEDAKIYLSWFKYDATHMAITEAIQRVGGISAIYQRAYDSHPSAEMTIAADVVFGYSPTGFELEKKSRSRFNYYVATGYLGDHRFALLRPAAQTLRLRLLRNGARRVVAFTDENSADDSRWHTGHDLPRESYAFLLEKVLSEPWLGLVLKPKVPRTLRRRLGPVARLLEEAEATGRCLIYEQATLHGTYPPAAASLAADVAIHGHLCAGTAAIESALAGVPTLLMDREGWSISPLYRLGEGNVVFKEWPALWQACQDQWFGAPIPRFGDWSPILDELDPFRDGRAAERMGTYLNWLMEGFKAGRDRETLMAEAAERYAEAWGNDKIFSGLSDGRVDLEDDLRKASSR